MDRIDATRVFVAALDEGSLAAAGAAAVTRSVQFVSINHAG